MRAGRSTSRAWPHLVAAMLAVAALTGPGARSGPAAQPAEAPGLTGQLLVATPEMTDPRFARTVIYMIHHDGGGAQGLIVNRPLGELPMAALLAQVGLESPGAQGTARLHSGGPVDVRRLLVLHSSDYIGPGTLAVPGGSFAFTAEPSILGVIAQGKGPRRVLFALGYAGWAPGQLEDEMRKGVWVRATADEAIVFDGTYDTKWDRAIARRKIDL